MNPERWRRVEQICHEALARDPEARAAYLDAACAGDGGLRLEVASLIAEHPRSEAFLAASPFRPVPGGLAGAADTIVPPPGPASPSLVGRTLSHYRIDGFLRAGGMGQVYRAWDTALDRQVAVKVLPGELAATADYRARFEREARALAELNHPNILTIHDVGLDDGAPFVVTELLEGETLREILTRRAPSVPQAVSCVLQAARGLAAAHRKGLVHRDIKPENLLLTTDGRLKLLDFGLARHAVPSGTGQLAALDSNPGDARLVMGTVAYMSPEQLKAESLDARSDIFSLGVVLHELLTGHHPFRRETLGSTAQAILHEPPPPPSVGDEPLSPALRGVLRRCLQKDRTERFENGHELLQALIRVQRAQVGDLDPREIEERSPYPGLRSFTEDEAHVFFGREAEVEALWSRILHQPLLAVMGPSGAGKTSFVRAGVVPARPDGWVAVVCTPGRMPMRSLGQALAPELTGDLAALRQLVSFDDASVAFDLLRRWRAPHEGALLVVDQFEELFTMNGQATQALFSAFLGRLATEADIHVVLSMRDDFLVRCCEQPPLAAIVSELTVLLPPARESLRRALVEPAATLGYRFEDEGLVDEMLQSVEGTHAALPLLAFAVSRVWERRDRERQLLTRAGYEESGGVPGALAQHAESTLERIGGPREALVREMFRNLVTVDGTRAMANRDELLSVWPDRAEAGNVLDQLVEARLLTAYEVAAIEGHPAQHVVEIAHESLLRAWPRLVRWQTQDAGSAQLRDQLRQSARLWDAKGRKNDFLWTGTAYTEFALWRAHYSAPLTPLEEDFARATAGRARRAKVLKRAAVAGVILGLSGVVAAVLVSRHYAVASAERAVASKLVALGRLELARYPTAAVAYARASLELSDTIEARLLAVEALWQGPTARILDLPQGATCFRVRFNPTGDALVCAGFLDRIVVFDDAGQIAQMFAGLPVKGDLRTAVFDGRDDRLVTWLRGDNALRSWLLPARTAELVQVPLEWARPLEPGAFATLEPAGHGERERVLKRWSIGDGTARVVARWIPPQGLRLDQPGLRPFAADRSLRWMAYADGRNVVVRDLRTNATPLSLERHGARVRELQFDDAGSRLLSVDEQGLFCLWSLPSGREQRELRTVPPHRYSLPTFRADGSEVTWTAGDGTTRVWDLRASIDHPPLLLRRTDLRDPGDASFDPRGRWLATAGWGSVALWPLGMRHVSAIEGHAEGPIQDLAFSPDSKWLASCARDGARLWPLAEAAARMTRLELGDDYYCYGVTFAPDGHHLAVSAPHVGVLLVPLDGGPARRLIDLSSGPWAPQPLAFDAAGRFLAAAPEYAPEAASLRLHVVDLASGRRRAFPLGIGEHTAGFGVMSLEFVANGDLWIAGADGIRRWTPATGAMAPVIWSHRRAVVDVDRAGRTVAALSGQLSTSRLRLFNPELVLLDAEGRVSRRITTHGNTLTPTLAIDAAGRFLVTGDADGIVRVGPIDGREPHLLLGHSGPVNRVAVSPDGRWIASASGQEIRLWPVPDLAERPFHTLPRAELIAKLQSLTNLRVVRDDAAATGWALEVGKFPGWKDVPSW